MDSNHLSPTAAAKLLTCIADMQQFDCTSRAHASRPALRFILYRHERKIQYLQDLHAAPPSTVGSTGLMLRSLKIITTHYGSLNSDLCYGRFSYGPYHGNFN